MFEETHFNLLFPKMEKKNLKILDKEFYDGKNWSWLNAFLFLVLSDKRMDPFQCWVFRIFNQIYWMIKSSHRPTLMKVDNRLTLVHFLHKSLEKMLMYDTALFLCPQQWRGKIFQLSHSFLFNYSLWHSILASLSSFKSMNDLRSILIKLVIRGYTNIFGLCFFSGILSIFHASNLSS